MVGDDHPDASGRRHQMINRLTLQVGAGEPAVQRYGPPSQLSLETLPESTLVPDPHQTAATYASSLRAPMEDARDSAINSRRWGQTTKGTVGLHRHGLTSARRDRDSNVLSESAPQGVR